MAIKPVHKMTEAQVRKEMSVFPLMWVETLDGSPLQHIIVFRKPAGTDLVALGRDLQVAST